jgi:dGTPase
VLALNEDLAEALALAHDLGHTPFGHAGEEELHRVMQPYGGFDHNAQTLRIITRLEHRYAEFPGLNLTWEALEGVVKHNGPLIAPEGGGHEPLPAAIVDYMAEHDLELHTHASLEAQVAALSDDIAYNNHDIDDGIRAGLFQPGDLFGLPLVGPVFRDLQQRRPELSQDQWVHEAVRRLITHMVEDLLAETRRRLDGLKPGSVEAVRVAGGPVAAFSEELQAADKALKAFLYERMYRHWRVNRMTSKARRIVRQLFELYIAEPDCLPPEWSALTDGPGTPRTARRVADFIAGMTDRFAIQEHRRLFDVTSQT